MRIFLTIVLTVSASTALAGEGDWIFYPGDYTHEPYTGKRVTQFAPDPVAYYAHGRNYQKSGYRYNNSTLRIGNSVDRYSTVETWGNGAVALGSTLLFQPYDNRWDDTVGPADFRRHARRVHRDYHDVHRGRGYHRHARDIDDTDDDGDSDHRRGGHRHGRHHRDHFYAVPGFGWNGPGWWGGPGFGTVITPGVGPGYGPGYGPGGWGPGGWGWGPGAGFGTGFTAAGSASNVGRVQWDEKGDSGSVEWGLDRNFYRDGHAYGWGGWGVPWHGGGGYRGHRPRPVPHRGGR